MKALWITLLSLSFGFSSVAFGETTDLDQLIKKVKKDQVEQSSVNKKREKDFIQQRDRQKVLVGEAKTNHQTQKKLSEKLQKEFAKTESQLADAEEKLRVAMGTLGEMYGVVRQVAADTYSNFENSQITAQNKDRMDFLKELSAAKNLATTDDLKKLWVELLNEMNESGKVKKVSTEILLSDGAKKTYDAVRVGAFNTVADGKYATYIPETKELAFLSRQPSSALSGAEDLLEGNSRFVDFTVDPTRGMLLEKMVQAPKLSERLSQGGIVGYVILAVLLVGIALVIERSVKLSKVSKQIGEQLKTKKIIPENPLGKILSVYKTNDKTDVDSLEIKLQEAITKQTTPLDKGINTVKILAAIAPLLGLLGTVTGMIGTFQSITLFGTSDPKLMAGGISQALITTVLGLVAAIPLILLHSLISTKSKKVAEVLEEQASGLLVERIETGKA